MSTEFFNDQWRIPSNENQNKISNYSMEFDNVANNSISLGNTLTNGFSELTVSVWANFSSLPGGNRGLISKDFTNQRSFEIRYTTAGVNFIVSTNGSQIFSSSVYPRSSINIGQWYHFVGVYDGSNILFYVDGTLIGTPTALTGSLQNTTSELNIGLRSASPSNTTFDGKIDQVSIFDYALSQDQVTQLGAQGYAFASGGSLSGSIDLANPVALGTNKTVSFWFKLSSSGNFSFSPFTSIVNGGNCYYPYFLNSSSTYKWYVSDSGCGGTGSVNIGSGGTVERNKWVHAAVVGDGSNVECYINGLSVAPITPKPDRNPTIQRLFTGMTQLIEFSNFSIFNTNLPETGTESISSLYNNGNPPDLTNYSNIIHWWKLDDADTFDGTDWTVTDYIGSNTGTSNGMNASNLVASNINGELIANPMITSPKPIAYYQLGDQSVSTGPSSDYLVPNNSLSDYVFDFDGAQSISSTIGELTTATDITISCWVKINSTQSGNPRFFTLSESSYPGTNGVTLLALYNSSLNQFYFSFGTGVQYISSSFSQPTNTWHSIIITYGASAGQVYLNGVSVGLSVPASTLNLTNALKLNSNNTLDGELSNVSIFNSRLSSSQIETLYNNGAPALDISSLSPTAWYKLNASEIFNNTSTEWSIDNNAYPSVYKSSLNFDGVNDYLDANRTVASNLDFSVSAWINPTSHDTAILGTRGLASASTSNGFTMLISPSGNLRVRIFTETSNNFEVQTGSTISLNNWSHVAMTYDSSTKTLKSYLNGAQAGSIVGTDPSVASIADLDIGRASIGAGSPHDYFNGEISNAAIFNTKLTSAQVTTIYNNGTPEASISHSPVSWYKLDNTTTGVQDSAGSNNGTNNGATEYAGFVNGLAGESVGMDSSNLVVSDLQQTSGYSPYALSLDGTGQVFNLDSEILLSDNKSVSFWFKLRVVPTGQFAILLSNSNSRFYPLLENVSGNFQVYIQGTANQATTITNRAIESNVWYNFIITGDGTTPLLYINGTQYTFGPSPDLTDVLIGDIGARPNGSFDLDGDMSNVAIWSGTTLSSTEVTEVYNQGVPSNLNTFSGTKPTAWWQLGSNSSFNAATSQWTCLDEIGTNNAASLTNMANDDITNGVGYSANGLGSSTIDIKGDAPYSTANGLSENMDVLDRVSGTGNVPS